MFFSKKSAFGFKAVNIFFGRPDIIVITITVYIN